MMHHRIVAIIALFSVLLTLSQGSAVRASPPPLPSSFNGTVQVDGAYVPEGTVVSAWIDGVRYAEATATFYAGYSVYGIGVPGDHPDTPEKDGGVEGDTIVFRIGDLVADQRGTFNSGSNEHLDLTASTSVEYGSIVLVKETNPAGGTGFDFSGDLGGFSLDDGDSETFGNLLPGSYDVTEDVPAGWDLDGVMCSGGDSTRIADGVTIELDEGEDVTCVFTNVERGSIVVVKETDPPGASGFEFIGDLGSFALDDGGSRVFDDLVSGDYDVIEALPVGWNLDDVVCTGGDSNVAADGVTVHLDPGEDVVCTFTNVERTSITVVKETDPDGGMGFDFGGDLGDFTLDDDASETFDVLLPGDYDVTETLPASWMLDDVVCAGGDGTRIAGGVQVHLDLGEHVVCTFTNVERGSITVVKETNPEAGAEFEFTGELGGFFLDDGESESFGDLPPGDYDVAESKTSRWKLDAVACVGGDGTTIGNGVQVHLGAGESVTCTFTNIQYRCYIPLFSRN